MLSRARLLGAGHVGHTARKALAGILVLGWIESKSAVSWKVYVCQVIANAEVITSHGKLNAVVRHDGQVLAAVVRRLQQRIEAVSAMCVFPLIMQKAGPHLTRV